VTLSTAQWQRIHANQSRELETLIGDREETRRLAMTAPYGRIGEWLEADAGGTVLELGCGPGRFVAMLAHLGYRVVGVDPYGGDSFPTWERVGTMPDVRLLGGIHAEALPFSDGEFEHAACMGALLYFDDPVRALRELHRVVKPGGRLVLRTVNRENLYTATTGKRLDPVSKNLYSRDELVSLVQAGGFRVEETFTYGFWPPVATQYWWYMVNTIVTPPLQRFLSALTPRRRRVNITVLATREDGSGP
jgi:SAM-dependent methyltransferase